MKSLNEIKRVLFEASIVLREQEPPSSEGTPVPPWMQGWPEGMVWTPELIEMLGQTIMNTEQYGDWWHANTIGLVGNAQEGWVVVPDPDGGQGSGNMQPGFWANAWGYPCCPLGPEHYQLYQDQVVNGGHQGHNTQYWIGVTAMMYLLWVVQHATDGNDFVTFPENCDLMCILTLIYIVYLRGPEGQDADEWGKLADRGLKNFLKNWQRLQEITDTNKPEDETEDETEEELPHGITPVLQQWLDKNEIDAAGRETISNFLVKYGPQEP